MAVKKEENQNVVIYNRIPKTGSTAFTQLGRGSLIFGVRGLMGRDWQRNKKSTGSWLMIRNNWWKKCFLIRNKFWKPLVLVNFLIHISKQHQWNWINCFESIIALPISAYWILFWILFLRLTPVVFLLSPWKKPINWWKKTKSMSCMSILLFTRKMLP